MALATPIIAATYAEIALKGRNRSMFLRKLINNLSRALKDYPVKSITHVESRILVHLEDPSKAEDTAEAMRKVFGLQWISPAVSIARQEVDQELEDDLVADREPQLSRVCEVACILAGSDKGEARNFRVSTRRSDPTFRLESPALSRLVGGAVHMEYNLPGKMVDPDFVVNVLVLKENILVFTKKVTAYGGLPMGSSGRLMVLLSGGIDSPVAAWLMMRRGCRPEFIHFYSGRSIEEADVGKIKDLVRNLKRFSPVPLALHMIPVVPYETRSIGVVPDRYDMVLFRRFMVLMANWMARRNNCLAMVTGDSVGQVASQTLHNLNAISPDVSMQILRPLVGMDKMEIIAWSKEIDAFATSVLPYRDCCSIRSPKPVLNARPEDVLRYSEEMDMPGAVEEAMSLSTRVVIGEKEAIE